MGIQFDISQMWMVKNGFFADGWDNWDTTGVWTLVDDTMVYDAGPLHHLYTIPNYMVATDHYYRLRIHVDVCTNAEVGLQFAGCAPLWITSPGIYAAIRKPSLLGLQNLTITGDGIVGDGQITISHVRLDRCGELSLLRGNPVGYDELYWEDYLLADGTIMTRNASSKWNSNYLKIYDPALDT